MKIIDRLLIKSFLPPFVVTFFIALFVLIMQFLWKWIDEIAGKGAGFLFILEMLGYMCISLIPLALPIAVLISSVMVMGNLAERYELSSFKSAGVSLARVMLPLMFLTGAISLFSYICSDQLIPISNLKYQSRLYDIKNQKPTLSLEEGVFNDDFQGFSIRIGNKKADDKTIEDVMMYDEGQNSTNKFSQVLAKSGEMSVTKDDKYFVMKLYDGNQYTESRPSVKDGKNNYPFVRTSFNSWTKVFDLNEFQLDRTDENLFKGHHNMLRTSELISAIDSIENKRQARIESMQKEINRSFHERKKEQDRLEREQVGSETIAMDSLENLASLMKMQQVKQEKINVTEIEDSLSETAQDQLNDQISVSNLEVPPTANKKLPARYFNAPQQLDTLDDLSSYSSLLTTFRPQDKTKLLTKAKAKITGVHQNILATIRAIDRTGEKKIDHLYHLHNKFSTAVACFIFLFVGAPMGAIVRKGGFGYPLLISVVFFVTYIIMTILFKKMMESSAISPVLGAWMPCLIILPIGIWLTVKAMNDSKLLESNRLSKAFKAISDYLRKTFQSRKLART